MGEPKLQVEEQGHVQSWGDLKLITIWGTTREWLKLIAKWSPKQSGRPKWEELRPIECLILVQSWKTKEVKSCAPEHRMQQGQEGQPSEQRATEELCQRREGPIPKWKLKSGKEECREAEAGLSSVGPLRSGRLIPEQNLNEERDTKMSLEAKSSARPQDHYTSASSSLLKTAKLHPGAQHSVWCQTHHTGVTLITEQQLRVLHSPNNQPWSS